MRYRVLRDMTFITETGEHDWTRIRRLLRNEVLEAGTLVDEVAPDDIPIPDRVALRIQRSNLAKSNANARMIAFMWNNVVRLGIIGEDLMLVGGAIGGSLPRRAADRQPPTPAPSAATPPAPVTPPPAPPQSAPPTGGLPRRRKKPTV